MEKSMKLDIYKRALGNIQSGDVDHLCVALKRSHWIMTGKWITIGNGDIFQFYPEILKYKPTRITGEDIVGAWWQVSSYGKKKRIAVLENIIKELEDHEKSI